MDARHIACWKIVLLQTIDDKVYFLARGFNVKVFHSSDQFWSFSTKFYPTRVGRYVCVRSLDLLDLVQYFQNIQIRRFLFWKVWNSGSVDWPRMMDEGVHWVDDVRGSSRLYWRCLPHLRNRSSDTAMARPRLIEQHPVYIYDAPFKIKTS